MSLSQTEIKHIAELARIDLTDDELKLFAEQLDSILEYVNKIQELDLSPSAPQMAHAAGLVNVFRDDVVSNCGEETRKAMLELFTSKKGDLLSTKSSIVKSDI